MEEADSPEPPAVPQGRQERCPARAGCLSRVRGRTGEPGNGISKYDQELRSLRQAGKHGQSLHEVHGPSMKCMVCLGRWRQVRQEREAEPDHGVSRLSR